VSWPRIEARLTRAPGAKLGRVATSVFAANPEQNTLPRRANINKQLLQAHGQYPVTKQISFLLNEALVMHQRGALNEAAARYSQLVNMAPRNVDARCLLGMVLAEQRRFAEAAEHFRKAVRIAPAHAAAHDMLGLAFAELNRVDDALKSFDRAIRHEPQAPSAYIHRATLLVAIGRPSEAVETYDRALTVNPNFFEAWCNRGLALDAAGRPAEAVSSYDRALALQPNSPEAHFNRGNALGRLGRHMQAVASFDCALALRSDFAEACLNRGNALRELERLDDALVSYEQALAIRGDMAEAHFSRGIALVGLARFEDAVACFDRALTLEPFRSDTRRRALLYFHRAATLDLLGRSEEAFADVDVCLQLAPNDDEILYLVSRIELLHGRWREGWPKHERRLALKTGTAADFVPPPCPLWAGEKLHDELLVIRCEFGNGDRIQFGCFAAHLAKLGVHVALWNTSKLSPLLATIPGVERVVSDVAELGDVRPLRWVPMMSLPRILGTTPDTIPQTVPFLAAEPARVAAWKDRLGGIGFRIGIAWQGNPEYAQDRYRSVPLSQFAPLADIPGVRLISLQKGFGSEQIAHVPFGDRIEVLGDDFDDGPAFLDSAAVMTQLDLIVTSDTSVPHLAGALGRPVFVALGPAVDWRWLLGREDSPWYPTARLFRQRVVGDWADVFARIADAVRKLTDAHKGRG
jgi:tetratricopeptide (TPR) repeat protein